MTTSGWRVVLDALSWLVLLTMLAAIYVVLKLGR